MAEVTRKIELLPHVAMDRLGREITFAQDQIYLNGVRVGYVGHGHSEGIALIRPCDEGTIEAISAAVTAKRGSAPSHVAQAPVIEERVEDSSDD